jgi:hypothetical protein
LRKRSAHLTRQLVEGVSSYSPYKGAKLRYVKDYDPIPQVNVDLISKMDLHRAIKILHQRKELSEQEVKMLMFVMLDGRLSRRDISAMIQESEGVYVNQRTISRRLESAYYKISKFLGFEYGDNRMFQIVAKQLGKPAPYILNDDEIESAQQTWERV